MFGAYRSKKYSQYLQEISKYEMRIVENFGKSCVTCKFASDLFINGKFQCFCKHDNQKKNQPNSNCPVWEPMSLPRYSEKEFKTLAKHHKKNRKDIGNIVQEILDNKKIAK